MQEGEQKSVNICVSSLKPGKNKKASFIVEVTNGKKFSFDIIADFVGPKIKIHSPNINFGLN